LSGDDLADKSCDGGFQNAEQGGFEAPEAVRCKHFIPWKNADAAREKTILPVQGHKMGASGAARLRNGGDLVPARLVQRDPAGVSQIMGMRRSDAV
jgi:hypothetical protein